MNVHGSYLMQTWLYSNAATIISNTLKPIFHAQFPGCNLLIHIEDLADQDALHFMVWQLCMTIQNLVCLSHRCYHCWKAPSTTSLCSHLLVGLWKCSAGIYECQQMQFFSTWRNLIIPLCFTCISVSDTVLSERPSTAVMWQQKAIEY